MRWLWPALLIIGGVYWGVTTLVHHHKVGSAEAKLGQPRIAAIDEVAHVIVADYYMHPTKGGGTWGQQTCAAFDAGRSTIGSINRSVETVFADRVDRYWDEDPHHQSNTDLRTKPTLAEIRANCY
jgi:hypothetical protein